MRFAAALGLFVAFATAVCPFRVCFAHGEEAASSAPGHHGHEDHEGPDSDATCCVDVPAETGGPWFVVHLELPCARFAEPGAGPRTPTPPPPWDAPRVVPVRTTVLLR